MPASPGLNEENLKALILLVCEYLAGLNTACFWSDRQFRPLIEARVQSELYELLLGWIEALPAKVGARPATPEITACVVSRATFDVGLQWDRDAARSAEETADRMLPVIVRDLGDSMLLTLGVP